MKKPSRAKGVAFRWILMAVAGVARAIPIVALGLPRIPVLIARVVEPR